MPNNPPAEQKANGKVALGGASAFVMLALVAPAIALLFPNEWGWCLVMLVLLVFMILLGQAITGQTLGILINEQNVISLARFQAVTWTLLVMSAFLVVAAARIEHAYKITPPTAVYDPLDIKVDERLWSLIGLSITSLVGSSLVAGTKKTDVPAEKEKDKTATALVAAKDVPDSVLPMLAGATVRTAEGAEVSKEQVVAKVIDTNRQGLLYANPNSSDASWSDMFQGDEVGNTAHLDLGKVQMFYFTLIAALSYGGTVFSLLAVHHADPGAIDALPCLSTGMVTLLGISNAGFLVNKGVDHTEKKS